LTGHIFSIQDALPIPYATVEIPYSGVGSISDHQGVY